MAVDSNSSTWGQATLLFITSHFGIIWSV